MRKGWTTKRLGEVGTFERGGGFLKSDYVDDGFPCIHYGQIHTTFGVSTHHHLTCIPEELAKFKSKLAKNGDVIIAITSEDVEGSCKCTAWLGGYDVAVGGHTAIFRHNLNPTFVSYYFRGRHYSLAKEKYAHGFKVVEIKPADIAKIDISYPSLSEQERIVAELDLLQGIIDKQKAQLKELDTLAQSIFYDMFGDPVENEKGWEIKEMRELFDIGSSKRVFESQWTDHGVPFYRAREIVRLSKGEPIESPIFISESLFQDYSTKYGVPSAGDIMVTAVGTLGTTYIVKNTDRFYFKDGNILWFKNKGLCESRFIQDEYSTSFVIDQIQGNANAAVVGTYTIMNANKTRVVVPPISLQKEYVERVSIIDGQKDKIKQSITETQKLFDYTMDKYFG